MSSPTMVYMVALFSVVLRDRDLKQLAGAFGGMTVDLHFTDPKSMYSPTKVYMVALFSVVVRDILECNKYLISGFWNGFHSVQCLFQPVLHFSLGNLKRCIVQGVTFTKKQYSERTRSRKGNRCTSHQ